jgi:hypothetical protein
VPLPDSCSVANSPLHFDHIVGESKHGRLYFEAEVDHQLADLGREAIDIDVLSLRLPLILGVGVMMCSFAPNRA